MDFNLKIVEILTVGFAFATLFGYIAHRFKASTILGYLLAGYIIGPYSPGYVADLTLAEELAEIGVILMLFGVGLHFKIEDLLKVKNVAIPGAIGQTALSAILCTFLVYLLGWPLANGVIIGLAIGVASTVVLVRVLDENALMNTLQGRIAVGWLIVEDLLTVCVLILLPLIAAFFSHQEPSLYTVLSSLALVILKFVALAFLMFTLGRKIVTYILKRIAISKSHELFTLTILTLTLGIASGSAYLFGTSIALGAFIAGMVIGQTDSKHKASENAQPMKEVFSVIFFLSVGMLFNPSAITENFALFVGVLAIILLIKPLIALVIVIALKYPFDVALTVAIALAQIGEFSFILAEAAMKYQLLPEAGYDVLVASALVSIALNPLLFRLIPRENGIVPKTSK